MSSCRGYCNTSCHDRSGVLFDVDFVVISKICSRVRCRALAEGLGLPGLLGPDDQRRDVFSH
jgi:hypothetical protein